MNDRLSNINTTIHETPIESDDKMSAIRQKQLKHQYQPSSRTSLTEKIQSPVENIQINNTHSENNINQPLSESKESTNETPVIKPTQLKQRLSTIQMNIHLHDFYEAEKIINEANHKSLTLIVDNYLDDMQKIPPKNRTTQIKKSSCIPNFFKKQHNKKRIYSSQHENNIRCVIL